MSQQIATPFVSCIMTARNAESTITDAARSILEQSITALELIIVDDGSSDATPQKLAELKEMDGRVRSLRTKHRGVAAAANAGIDMASGAFIARHDADDIARPTRFARQLAYLDAHPELDVATTQSCILNPADAGPGIAAWQDWANGISTQADFKREALIEMPFANPTVFARRAVFAKTPYALKNGPEDYEWFLRALRDGWRFGKVREPLLDWGVHPGGKSLRARFTARRFAEVKCDHLLKSGWIAGRKVGIQGAGRHGKWWLRLLLAAGVEVVAMFDVAKKRHGKLIDAVPVYPLSDLGGHGVEAIVAAVGQKGANKKRAEQRAQLQAAGFSEGPDFILVC